MYRGGGGGSSLHSNHIPQERVCGVDQWRGTSQEGLGLVPGDLVRVGSTFSFEDGYLCVVLGVREVVYETDTLTNLTFLHPVEGVVERALVYFNGDVFVGMRRIRQLQCKPEGD